MVQIRFLAWELLHAMVQTKEKKPHLDLTSNLWETQELEQPTKQRKGGIRWIQNARHPTG